MTSNLGAEIYEKFTSYDEQKQKVLEAVWRHFRPEFFNRLEEIIVFHSLGEEEMKKIVELRIKDLAQRLAEKKLKIVITDAAKNYLAEKSYNQKLGARPLERLIVREITDVLALMTTEGKIKPGQKILVDFQEGQIKIQLTA
jgi:ATP-dependent Clp protease ATP-binding subunit ClpA